MVSIPFLHPLSFSSASAHFLAFVTYIFLVPVFSPIMAYVASIILSFFIRMSFYEITALQASYMSILRTGLRSQLGHAAFSVTTQSSLQAVETVRNCWPSWAICAHLKVILLLLSWYVHILACHRNTQSFIFGKLLFVVITLIGAKRGTKPSPTLMLSFRLEGFYNLHRWKLPVYCITLP